MQHTTCASQLLDFTKYIVDDTCSLDFLVLYFLSDPLSNLQMNTIAVFSHPTPSREPQNGCNKLCHVRTHTIDMGLCLRGWSLRLRVCLCGSSHQQHKYGVYLDFCSQPNKSLSSNNVPRLIDAVASTKLQ